MYNRIIGLIGPTGSGKSYTASQLMASMERCAVYQLKRIHEEPAFIMVADDIIDGDVIQFAIKLGEPQFHYVYLCKPPEIEGKKMVCEDLDIFIRACYVRERMCMLIDEAHFFCDPWHIPPFFRQAVVMGRSRYLDTLYCAQKFSTISKELTANSHEFYFWRIGEPGDINSIAERCGEDCAGEVANLRASEDKRKDGGEFIPGMYVHWSNTGKWEVIDPWTKQQSSTYSSGESASQVSSQSFSEQQILEEKQENGSENLESNLEGDL